jgi:hypothetical protein
MNYATMLFAVAALAALTPHPFAGGSRGMGFDDLGFAPTPRKVMVPGGSTGKLALIEPDFQNIEIIAGFSESTGYSGGHGEGITSSDACRGLMYVTDRCTRLLEIVDPQAKKIIARAPLASEPDYVRIVSETNEVWVTEPGAERIGIFSLPEHGTPAQAHRGFPLVAGPQSTMNIAYPLPFFRLHCSVRAHLLPSLCSGRWTRGCWQDCSVRARAWDSQLLVCRTLFSGCPLTRHLCGARICLGLRL